ncbi:hypothetical protein [Haloarchaeobius amylolyticus]|uniref:hypothetical protein n=1 Tax=Haloarchaeobius amylolyticus TaxID=1198296 RepID=UPI00226F5E58|nr:hypothetical protein [Haloarchaeobius amylolyticus]
MVAFYLLARLAIVVGFYLLRLIPIAGHWAARSYDERLFGPVEDRLSVVDVAATREDGSVTVDLTVENATWLDLSVAGCNLQLRRGEDGRTLSAVTWPPAFDHQPSGLSTEVVPGEGEGTVEVSGPAPPGEKSAEAEEGGGEADRESTLAVDGSLLLEPSFSVGDQTFTVGQREFAVDTGEVAV